jgi:hypothetical protein
VVIGALRERLMPGHTRRLMLRAARALGSSRDCRDHAEAPHGPYAVAAPQFPTLDRKQKACAAIEENRLIKTIAPEARAEQGPQG